MQKTTQLMNDAGLHIYAYNATNERHRSLIAWQCTTNLITSAEGLKQTKQLNRFLTQKNQMYGGTNAHHVKTSKGWLYLQDISTAIVSFFNSQNHCIVKSCKTPVLANKMNIICL